MDQSARHRMPAPPPTSHRTAPQTSNSRQQLPEPGHPPLSAPVGEIDGKVNQVALVERTLCNGTTPTLVARIAMLIARMQTQADHPDRAA